MATLSATCAKCGTGLPSAVAAKVPRPPCPACGSTDVDVVASASGGASARGSGGASYELRLANDATTRCRALQAAVADVEAAIAAGKLDDALGALTVALENLHGLGDCLKKRREWTQTGWSADDLAAWRAHWAARNASHHSSSPIAMLRSGTVTDQRFVWALDLHEVQGYGAGDYEQRLDGQPVLPPLRALAARVASSIP